MNCFLGPALRTPLGTFGGALRGIQVPELAALLARRLMAEGGLPDRLVLASALPAGQGPDPAQETLHLADTPTIPAFLVQRGMASGLWGLILGWEALAAGSQKVLVLAGDAPSAAPYLLPTARWGKRMGETELRDALLECTGPVPEPTPWVTLSRQRAARAQALGAFHTQCCPLPRRRWPQGLLENDEALIQPGPLPWADGAAGLMLQSAPTATRLLGWAQAATPREALDRVLEAQDLRDDALNRVEVDQLIPQDPATVLPGIDPALLSPDGDAWALGHPLGASGMRALVGLTHALEGQAGSLGALVQVTEAHSWAILLAREAP